MSVPAVAGDQQYPSPMNIGQVLTHVRSEFPEITISKIRFLEEQGLVHPSRTKAGYRQFSDHDVQRLRYVLAVQRDYYVPLKVISEYLQALDHGENPAGISPLTPPLRAPAQAHTRAGSSRDDGAGAGGKSASSGRATGAVDGGGAPDSQWGEVSPAGGASQGYPKPGDMGVAMTRNEVIRATGIDEKLFTELENFGLISPDDITENYTRHTCTIVAAACALAEYGIDARHLRAFRTAAAREANLVEQVVTPRRRKDDQRSREMAHEVAELALKLHTALLDEAIDALDR